MVVNGRVLVQQLVSLSPRALSRSPFEVIYGYPPPPPPTPWLKNEQPYVAVGMDFATSHAQMLRCLKEDSGLKSHEGTSW